MIRRPWEQFNSAKLPGCGAAVLCGTTNNDGFRCGVPGIRAEDEIPVLFRSKSELFEVVLEVDDVHAGPSVDADVTEQGVVRG